MQKYESSPFGLDKTEDRLFVEEQLMKFPFLPIQIIQIIGTYVSKHHVVIWRGANLIDQLEEDKRDAENDAKQGNFFTLSCVDTEWANLANKCRDQISWIGRHTVGFCSAWGCFIDLLPPAGHIWKKQSLSDIPTLFSKTPSRVMDKEKCLQFEHPTDLAYELQSHYSAALLHPEPSWTKDDVLHMQDDDVDMSGLFVDASNDAKKIQPRRLKYEPIDTEVVLRKMNLPVSKMGPPHRCFTTKSFDTIWMVFDSSITHIIQEMEHVDHFMREFKINLMIQKNPSYQETLDMEE